jgi:hypothetical protein
MLKRYDKHHHVYGIGIAIILVITNSAYSAFTPSAASPSLSQKK